MVEPSGCNIYVNSVQANGDTTYKLTRIAGQMSQFQPLTLTVLPFSGSSNFSGYNIQWMYNGNAVAGSAGKLSLSVNKPGEYKAVLTLKSNPQTICEAVANISGEPCKLFELDLSCQVPNNISLPNAVAAGIQLGVGDEFTAGDYTVVVTEITSGSPAGWKGKGYVKMKLVAGIVLKQISVNFENAVVNECYELASGSVVTDYDPNWGGVLDLDDSFSFLDRFVSLQNEMVELLENFTGSDKEKEKINSLVAELKSINSLVQLSPDFDQISKNAFQFHVTETEEFANCSVDPQLTAGARRSALENACKLNPWAVVAKCLGAASLDLFMQYTCAWVELIVDGNPKSFTDFNGVKTKLPEWDEVLGSSLLSCAFSAISIPNNKVSAILVAGGAVEAAAQAFASNLINQYNNLKDLYSLRELPAQILWSSAFQDAATQGIVETILFVTTKKIGSSDRVLKFAAALRQKVKTKGFFSARQMLKASGLNHEAVNSIFNKLDIQDGVADIGKVLQRESTDPENIEDIATTGNITKWLEFEETVTGMLSKANKDVGSQITIDVTLKSGVKITIRVDNLVKNVNGEFKLVDSKSSTKKILDKGNLKNTLTKNQKVVFPEIDGIGEPSCQIQTIKLRGKRAMEFMNVGNVNEIDITNKVLKGVDIYVPSSISDFKSVPSGPKSL